MSDPVHAVREATRLVLEKLAVDEKSIEADERAANEVLERCANRRRLLVADREAVVKGQEAQLRILGAALPASAPAVGTEPLVKADISDDIARPQSRARIGPQRYLILASLRDSMSMSLDELVEATKLPIKRIREQLKSDMPIYVATLPWRNGEPTEYRLQEAGEDLLHRFEAYRAARGEPLPTVEDVQRDLAAEAEFEDEAGGPAPRH